MDSGAHAVDADQFRVVQEFDYVVDPKEWIVMRRSGLRYYGHLDSAGSFIPHPKMKAYAPDEVIITGDKTMARDANRPRNGEQETVYEYRSGRLIRGILNRDGDFIPELDCEVLSFDKYVYSQKALRIYNLPGQFRPKGQSKVRGFVKHLLSEVKPGMSMEKVDELLGEKVAHERETTGNICSYYYTKWDIVVDFDKKGAAVSARPAEPSKK